MALNIPSTFVDISWPFPNFNRPHKLWALSSAVIIPTVGLFSKFIAKCLNNVQVYNRDVLINALDNRSPTTPLITVSNHHSCMDDPLLWGLLNVKHYQSTRMRWGLGAHDICFTNELHALFFALGRTVPIIRGNGVYQKAMDFILERLNRGDWVHIFPEGKVNMGKNFMRFKWGVGRLISECTRCPIVIPMYHLGMDDILPNEPPYIPRRNQKVTVVVGKPLQLEPILNDLKYANKNSIEQRKMITDFIQQEIWKLHDEAKALHHQS